MAADTSTANFVDKNYQSKIRVKKFMLKALKANDVIDRSNGKLCIKCSQ